MKRRIITSIALALSIVFVSLMSSDSAVNAQQGSVRFRADTGVITPGPNQALRVTVAMGDADGNGRVEGNDAVRVRFRRSGYIEQGNVYRVASESTSAPITLRTGEAASFDLPASFQGGVYVGVRGLILGNVLSGSVRDVRVTTIVFDTSTQRIVAAYEGYLEIEG